MRTVCLPCEIVLYTVVCLAFSPVERSCGVLVSVTGGVLVSIVALLHIPLLVSALVCRLFPIVCLIVVHLSVLTLFAPVVLTLGKRTVGVSSGIVVSPDLLVQLPGIGVSTYCRCAIAMSFVDMLIDMSAVVGCRHRSPRAVVTGIVTPPVV